MKTRNRMRSVRHLWGTEDECARGALDVITQREDEAVEAALIAEMSMAQIDAAAARIAAIIQRGAA
jgi:hypothetical protein